MHLCLHTIRVRWPYSLEKGFCIPPELGLKLIVNCLVGARIKPQVSGRAPNALNE